ncbi:hypothetical protein Prudu_005325 [Prunus dulcis]|uniref:Uncharacterized protein n=1 Tax=Prunus dulcis TaxID=3755 RepID=A0A4Y1QXC5_PRUDU|nr:hypothetical protein Prudu_005325 [Prunus dulcis]
MGAIIPLKFSGGLWLLWDATKVHVDILGTSDQSISASVAWPGQSPWLFTAVYTSPCGIKRAKLWEYLSFIADCQHLPWLIAGDFNEMLNVNDKLGGVPVYRLKAWGPSDGTAVEKTFALIERLKHWNINVFGQLRQRKSWLLARIAGIQRALCKGPNSKKLCFGNKNRELLGYKMECRIPEKLNYTLITLVPKVDSPLRHILPHIISPNQMIWFLFAEANSTQARVLKSCLERKETAKEVSLICGSPLTEDLSKYLGMPMLHSRITKLTYGSLIDKVHKRLASWKSKFLSLAGRATLIQAVTSAVPIYAMQTSKLPVSVGQELDKLNRNFFWGGSEKKLKIHLCQWDLACRPKHKGGLGFKKTTAMNKALLAKVGGDYIKTTRAYELRSMSLNILKGNLS